MTARLVRAVIHYGCVLNSSVLGPTIDPQLRIARIKAEILMVAKFENVSDTA
jgi:hypothetical protein